MNRLPLDYCNAHRIRLVCIRSGKLVLPISLCYLSIWEPTIQLESWPMLWKPGQSFRQVIFKPLELGLHIVKTGRTRDNFFVDNVQVVANDYQKVFHKSLLWNYSWTCNLTKNEHLHFPRIWPRIYENLFISNSISEIKHRWVVQK